ncbi:competence protein CoiA family protein [Calothrix sp. UHCC 0171]|uniref:competence protein CoiA family protein n=1 Tax=Calothrix sp. UHCC 0171 TaxID=3110245 RepID=UPI002B217C04|nr:competence protein CoiA family protein [Calothrix sp. UHCC 0171]MEA5572551.1 competence protein CoiA family protein [Calothrix sp. UHCC 0171]
MFYAKSMYRGGIIIRADDSSYSSYKNDGICCLICNEEVILKGGSKKRKHFAHRKSCPDSKCELRFTSQGFTNIWNSFSSGGKGQKQKLFKDYFLSIIQGKDQNSKNNIEILKQTILPDILKNIEDKCVNYFYDKKSNLIEEYLSLSEDNNSQLILHKIIASEALKYLSSPSAKRPLKEVISYTIYNYIIKKYSDLQELPNKWNHCPETMTLGILREFKETILNADWLSAFEKSYQTSFNEKIDLAVNCDFYKYLKCRQSSSTWLLKKNIVFLKLESSVVYLMEYPDDKTLTAKNLTKLANITKVQESGNELIIELVFLDDKSWLYSCNNNNLNSIWSEILKQIDLSEILKQIKDLIKFALKKDTSVNLKLDKKELCKRIIKYCNLNQDEKISKNKKKIIFRCIDDWIKEI